ncbi:hypothetical protein CEXT_137691 [Caerostris extrusa]|uniref:Uncharacterized protein n=1 Tax=Caerostris extrusa TaxID=172846 RepID=A0AAV4Y753_CAEEX|nr:hypothetical protein CEXT_137691 [Caerostris extrusa]
MRSPSTSLTSSLQIFPILKRTMLLTSRYFVQQFVHKGPHCEAIKGLLCQRGRSSCTGLLDAYVIGSFTNSCSSGEPVSYL